MLPDNGRGGKTIVSEAGKTQDKAHRVLRAAVVEARGEPGVYVSRDRVMQQTNVSDPEEFLRIAEHLAERGFVAEGDEDYGFFVVTLEGIAEGARY